MNKRKRLAVRLVDEIPSTNRGRKPEEFSFCSVEAWIQVNTVDPCVALSTRNASASFWLIIHAAIATREISCAWNELDWVWILKHWRNCSVCDGNLQNCPSLPRRAQLPDRRTFVERYFRFPIRGKLSRRIVLYFRRPWGTRCTRRLSRSNRFGQIAIDYQTQKTERGISEFFFFFASRPTADSETFFAVIARRSFDDKNERVIDSRIEISRRNTNRRTNAWNDVHAWIIYKNN